MWGRNYPITTVEFVTIIATVVLSVALETKVRQTPSIVTLEHSTLSLAIILVASVHALNRLVTTLRLLNAKCTIFAHPLLGRTINRSSIL